jgi:restriction system protein
LLFTLGSAMSIFAPSKNNAVPRLEHLLGHGTDPGNASLMGLTPRAADAGSPADTTAQADVDEPELAADIEQVALDQITARIAEEFAGHGLATLVAAILTAEGFSANRRRLGPTVASTSPPGAARWVWTAPGCSYKSNQARRSARRQSLNFTA